MSFILDALKKSESDRQRQNGPALFEVKVAPRRIGLPLWAIAIGVLLGINLIIVVWMLLRHPAARTDAVAAATPAAAPVTPAVTAPVAQSQAVPLPTPSVVGPAAPAATVPTPVANAAQAQGFPPASSAATPGGDANPEDLAPAAEPAPMLGSHVKRGTADGVPLYQDAAVVPGTHIPALRLDLHVYSARPAERFVMINMKKLREGDALPEGVRVESITPDGAILSYSGSRFILPSQ